jgi:hypothetical protein
MNWPYNTSQLAYLYSSVLTNINTSITSDPNYYTLIYNAKNSGDTELLHEYLESKVNDATNAYLSNIPQLTLVISLEDETGLWVDSTTNSVSSCTVNSTINQLNDKNNNPEYIYNAKGSFPSALYINGLGIDSWIGNFSNSGPNPSPHFRLGVILYWFSC